MTEDERVEVLLSLAPGEARLMDWTPEEYHADRECTSRSQLEVLRRDGPQMFEARCINRTLAEKQTAAKRLGTLLHLRVLEPDKWKARLAPPKPYIETAPERPAEASGRAKAGTHARVAYEEWKVKQSAWEATAEALLDEWKASIRPDSITVTADEMARIEGMAAGLQAHPKAREILWEADGGVNEQAIVWRHPETGVLVRVLVDRMVPYELADGRTLWMVPDLKTTNDPTEEAFRRSMVKYGYHRQNAIYHDAVQALHPDDMVAVVFMAVRSTPVHEVGCYDFGPDELAAGRRQYESTLREFAMRRECNNWRASWQHGIRRMTLPEYEYGHE